LQRKIVVALRPSDADAVSLPSSFINVRPPRAMCRV